ncbi:MAG: hypothetical protein ACRC51_04200 [Cetobacterium sp.]
MTKTNITIEKKHTKKEVLKLKKIASIFKKNETKINKKNLIK